MKINGKFVYLRSLSIKDSKFIFNLRKIKNISYYLHQPPKTLKDQKVWSENNIKDKKTKDFIIVSKKKNKKIGTIALNNINLNQAEWGRWISVGSSIENVEASILLINYGFQKLKLKKIYSLTNINNKKIINYHKNTPAKYDGVIVSLYIIKNKKTNAAKYSFGKKDFAKFKKSFYFMTQSIQ